MHTDPEIEKRCPYCHPERKAKPPTGLEQASALHMRALSGGRSAEGQLIEAAFDQEHGAIARGLLGYGGGMVLEQARQHQALESQRRQYEAYQRQVRNIALQKYPESEGNA